MKTGPAPDHCTTPRVRIPLFLRMASCWRFGRLEKRRHMTSGFYQWRESERTGDKIMSVSFQGEPEVILGKPKVMFEWSNMVGFDFLYGYDISSDGQRFLMLEGGEPRTITVVLNWFEEFKQRIQE